MPAAVASAAETSPRSWTRLVERCRPAAGSSTSAPARPAGSHAVDASECEATFSAAPGQVVALVAGADAPRRSSRRLPRTTARRTAGRRSGWASERPTPSSDQRQRADAVRRSARSRAAAGAERCDRARLVRPARSSARLAELEICIVVGPEILGGSTRLKAGHGPEARPEHALDDLDDQARQDVREPHGRRPRGEREAARPGAADRPARDGRTARAAPTRPSRPPAASAKVAIVSLLADVDAEPHARGWLRRAETSDRRSSDEARRRSRARRRHARPGRRGGGRRADRPRRHLVSNGRGIAVPGFIDLQVNGFGGVDFLEADADGYRRAGEALLETGVTGYLPTLITRRRTNSSRRSGRSRASPRGRESSASTSKGRSSPSGGSARIRLRRGAIPISRLLERLLAAGPVRMMTLAPELPGALDADRRRCTRVA